MVRLNKYIARLTGISRREADILIESGRVEVNGKTARLGEQPDESSSITVNGKEIDKSSKAQYIALNKPVGYVCSRKQQGDSPTIYDLLPPELQQLKTVGRLDRDSSGIILLTNDGDFAHRMTHPSFAKTKIYEVELDKHLSQNDQQQISENGVQLDDGVSKFTVSPLDRSQKGPIHYTVTMSEGRNRQIRRTFAALGYTVTRLHRIRFGNYKLTNQQPGKYWKITSQ